MPDLLELAHTIQKLYEYFHEELTDEDFTPLSPQALFMANIEHKKGNWYEVNPHKMNEDHATRGDYFIVSEREKLYLLKVTRLIKSYTQTLPPEVSFRERLLYAKGLLPPHLLKGWP